MTTKLLKLALVGMLLALLLAACAPAAPATEEATEAPEATEAVTEAPEETEAPEATAEVTEAAAYEGMTLEADCSDDGSGSKVNKIEATDASTVVFTLCVPDPAFREKVAFTSFEIESPAW